MTSKFQPDHLARATPDNRPGKSLNRSHGLAASQAARHGDKPNIARDAGRSKDVFDLKIHGGMTERQVAMAGVGGMGHGVMLDGGEPSAAAAPLAHAYGGQVPKVRDAAPAKPGMRSRTGGIARSLDDNTLTDLGRAIKDQAANGGRLT